MAGPSAAIRSQCPNATSQNDGLMPAGMAAMLSVPVNIFVSPTGSDSNSGLSVDQPLLTPRAAWTLAASGWWQGRMNIIFAAGAYTLDAPSGFSYANGAGSKNGGSPIALIGGYTDGGQGVRTATSTSANGTVWTDNTLAMVANQYVGYFVQCVAGANAGRMGMIRGNDATSVTLQVKFPNANTAGDTWQILQPSVTFNIPAATQVVFGNNNNYLGLKGINFVYGAANSTLVFVDYVHAITEGLWINGSGGSSLIINTLAVLQDQNSGPWAQDGVNTPFSALRPAGIFFQNVTILMGNQALLTGAHVFKTTNLTSLFPCYRVELANPIGFSAGFTIANNSYFQTFDRNGGALPGALSAPGSSSTTPVRLLTGSRADIAQLDCQNMTGPCVSADDSSSMTCTTVTGTTGNADVGIQVTNMSRAKLTTCTVTGTNGDTRCNATITAYGALPVTDAATLTRIQ